MQNPKLQRYAQTTVESCLAVALLQMVRLRKGIRITKALEHACCFSALRYSRDDFVIGHLAFLHREFGVRWLRIVQLSRFASSLKRLRAKHTVMRVLPITVKTIRRQLQVGPLSVLIDDFALFRIFHYPHWVVVLERRGQKFRVFEPWEGREREVSVALLDNGIRMLRKHLRMSPQLVQLTE